MQKNAIFWSLTVFITFILLIPRHSYSQEFQVYSVYRGVDLGLGDPQAQKDYYISMGTADGLRPGMSVEVTRRISTYDVVSEKLFKEMTFPIAKLRVIHSEANASVARLEKMLPADKTPAISPNTVMVGDLVRFPQ